MSPACLSGRAYRSLESLNLDVIKSPPSNSWLSNSSNSPSSTLSESSNCPSLFAISTRKPRTPRKRPNQTYNEAAKILSTAHPKIFPLTKFTKKSHDSSCSNNNNNIKANNNNSTFLFEPTSDLLMLDPPPHLDRPHFSNPYEPKGFFNLFEKSCESPGEMEINSSSCFSEICDDIDYFQENFDAESILDEEIGDQGIDSIMGNLSTENNIQESVDDTNYSYSTSMNHVENFCYGYPVGLGFEFGYGLMRREMKAMKSSVDDDWWRFPSHVNMLDIITPQINDSQQNNINAKIPVEKKMAAKKKKKKKEKIVVAENNNSNLAPKAESFDDQPVAKTNGGLLLKLNYDGVLNAWSNKGSPFSGDAPGAETAGNDVQARLAQIDLFLENGGVREASVLRYKEKRRNRLFSKKIRYQVRKVNADRRPRMKGRFVRTPNSPDD